MTGHRLYKEETSGINIEINALPLLRLLKPLQKTSSENKAIDIDENDNDEYEN